MPEIELLFATLSERHPGVTDTISGFYAEAARVCLDRHHQSPVLISLSTPTSADDASAVWAPCDERTLSAWANRDEATEMGAYALCLAAVEASLGMVAIRRAENRTGADYYIAPIGTPADDLEEWHRLEVSGTDRGDARDVYGRLTRKVQQTRNGNSNLPARAAVIGFRAKLIALSEVVTP